MCGDGIIFFFLTQAHSGGESKDGGGGAPKKTLSRKEEEQEEQRGAMRMALARRMKQSLVESEEARWGRSVVIYRFLYIL